MDISGSISGTASQNTARTYTSTLSTTTTTTSTFQFLAGVVWQWQFTLVDPCGTTVAMREDLRLTAGVPFPPCCIPGYEKNITKPHGECYPFDDGTLVDLCATRPPTPAPTPAPPTPPTPQKTCQLEKHTACTGSDIRSTTSNGEAACCSLCQQESGCSAFTYYEQSNNW